LNLRPSGYEPDELPGCSTPRQKAEDGSQKPEARRGLALACGGGRFAACCLGRAVCCLLSVSSRSGGDLLFRGLSRSTMGAEGFHGRVRDGIGCGPLAMATRPARDRRRKSEAGSQKGFLVSGVLASGFRSDGLQRSEFVRLGVALGIFCCLQMSAVMAAHGITVAPRSDRGSRKPIERLVPVGCMRCRTSTPGLSTWWSTTVLRETWFGGEFPA
jgi:hypothetical protein